MKKTLYFTLVAFTFLTDGVTQTAKEWQIKEIRRLFKVINERSETVQPEAVRSDTLHPEGPLEITTWNFHGNAIKMQSVVHGKSGNEITDFYFGPDGLIFIFSQKYSKDKSGKPYTGENRYYFRDEETMIRWLDEDKKEVDPESEAFSQKAEELWNELNWLGELSFMLSSEKGVSVENEKIQIRETYFQGILTGQKLADVSANLEKGMLKTGEGSFEVYYIKNEQGDDLGYVPVENEYILTIVVTTPNAVTWDGLSVGSTFGELKEALGNVQVHGSELEGRTYAEKGSMRFLLDAYHYSYEVDESSIPPETKIRAIILRSPA